MSKLIPKSQFLHKYNVSVESFDRTEIKWTDLEAVFNSYQTLKPTLEDIGMMISNQLMKVKRVHSVRYRTKDEEHLIEKIIRKKVENADRVINLDNYLSEITDLVGLRAIHLFKEDWPSIHKVITATWDLKEEPKAYVRGGDNEAYQEAFTKHGCFIATHKRGYRSIHYVAKTKPAKTEYFVEIQVRTIFEEGWSEIDHNISYPYELDNPLYKEFLMILNRLAGSADEMGSFVKLLRKEMLDKERKIAELEDEIDKLKIGEDEKKKLKEGVATVGGSLVNYNNLLGVLPKYAGLGTTSLGGITTSYALGGLRTSGIERVVSSIPKVNPSPKPPSDISGEGAE